MAGGSIGRRTSLPPPRPARPCVPGVWTCSPSTHSRGGDKCGRSDTGSTGVPSRPREPGRLRCGIRRRGCSGVGCCWRALRRWVRRAGGGGGGLGGGGRGRWGGGGGGWLGWGGGGKGKAGGLGGGGA